MKKLAILLLLIAIPFFSSFKFASAACSNLYLNAFKGSSDSLGESLSEDEGTPSTTDNIVRLNARNSIGAGSAVSDFFGGSIGHCAESNASVGTFLQQKGTYGLTQQAAMFATNSFFGSPTGDIGVHYAGMLLPKEFVNQGGTAYAAQECGSKIGLTVPPQCNSASDYWKEMGLSKVWSASFGLAMAMVVVVLVVSGFMIMFRSKIGGQVTVTVSLALQNVLLASVMALASFALGVFFINLSKVLILLFANLLLATLWSDSIISGLLGAFLGTTYISDPLGLAAKLIIVLFAGDVARSVGTAAGILSFGGELSAVLGPLMGGVASLAGLFIAGVIQFNPLSATIYLIVRLIIMGAILVVSIRIFWTVAKIYIKMAIDVVIAPLIFVISAIPGNSNAVSDWLKRMFKNAIIPPLMFALVNVTVYITIKLAISSGTAILSDPLSAVTGGALPSSTAGLALFAIGPQAIVMIVLLNMVPTIPTLVEDMFSGKATGGADKAAGEMMKSLQKIPVAGALFN